MNNWSGRAEIQEINASYTYRRVAKSVHIIRLRMYRNKYLENSMYKSGTK